MNIKKGFCPICEGSGIDRLKMDLHRVRYHKTIMFYCKCWHGWLLEQRNMALSDNHEIIHQPMERKKEPGAIVLIIDKGNNKVLITTQIESGNPEELNHLLLGPTIQAPRSNLHQIHGAKRPPYAEILDGKNIEWISLWKDREKNDVRANHYTILEMKKEDIYISPNARWFSEREIVEATVRRDVNEHLSQIMWLLTCINSKVA